MARINASKKPSNQEAFEARPENKPINSMTLRPLFQGKSVNTPAFLLAVLSAEKLLEPVPKKKRIPLPYSHRALCGGSFSKRGCR